MDPAAIIFPAIALFFWTFANGVRMARLRVGAVNRREIPLGYYELYEGTETPAVRLASRHVQNLFEVPPLFYVVVLFLYVTGSVGPVAVGLAWAYVALRVVHTFVHLGTNVVPRRLAVFALSNFVLAGLWVLLLVAVLR
ncbi:MAG TPA: MAPEG family protein [Myxococcota bacterium]|nr:MAPEG family protein [Myxococcota bacterium]